MEVLSGASLGTIQPRFGHMSCQLPEGANFCDGSDSQRGVAG